MSVSSTNRQECVERDVIRLKKSIFAKEWTKTFVRNNFGFEIFIIAILMVICGRQTFLGSRPIFCLKEISFVVYFPSKFFVRWSGRGTRKLFQTFQGRHHWYLLIRNRLVLLAPYVDRILTVVLLEIIWVKFKDFS